MKQRGHTSETSNSGVNVGALAEAAQVSYEMARRYAEGLAIPRADNLQAVSVWLGVTPGGLVWGGQAEAIDTRVLEQCIRAIAEAQQRAGRTIPIEWTARLAAILYEEAIAGRLPEQSAVDLLLRAPPT